ncbi:MAG: hypothetical protein D6701_02730 [Gemmatimonadetes bacterium]|nr:MAG: hypothetical protein D6701_02730 [Gemmatimonadota bacterium]
MRERKLTTSNDLAVLRLPGRSRKRMIPGLRVGVTQDASLDIRSVARPAARPVQWRGMEL